MRKLFFILFCTTLISCGKEYCWKCNVVSRVPSTRLNNYDSTQITTVVCEKTQNEIEDYEEDGTMTTTSANGQPIVTTTKCEIKYQ